jgi:excisionase family DNA binding protein
MSGPVGIGAYGFFVDAQDAAAVARGQELLQAELRRNGFPWSERLELVRATAAVYADRYRRRPKLAPELAGASASDVHLLGNTSPEGATCPRLTTCEVADLAGTSESWIRELAKRGRLVGQRTPDGWLFRREDVTEWLKRRPRRPA